jgi:HK97 family phage major capsid protein
MKTIEEIGSAVADIKSQITQDLGRCTTETKKAFEELTAVKASAASMDEKLQAIQRATLRLEIERKMSFRDPIARIQADPQKREFVNAMVRKACGIKLSEAHVKALGEDATPGSTYIIGDLATEIYDVLAQYGAWNTLGTRRLGTKTTTYPVKTARPLANWILTEGGQIGADATKAGTSVDLEAEVVAVLVNVSLQLLQDAQVDVTQDVLQDMAQALAYRLDWSAFAADGTADVTDGGFTGIFVGGTAANAAAGNTTVSNLDLDDFIRCLTTVASDVLRRPARWWMHPTILAKCAGIKDNNKRPLFQTALEAPAPGAIGSILGYPVTLVEAAPSTDAAGNVVAVFGDPQGCIVGVRNDFELAASDEHLWDYYSRSFRGVGRAGVKIRAATAFAKLTTAAQ